MIHKDQPHSPSNSLLPARLIPTSKGSPSSQNSNIGGDQTFKHVNQKGEFHMHWNLQEWKKQYLKYMENDHAKNAEEDHSRAAAIKYLFLVTIHKIKNSWECTTTYIILRNDTVLPNKLKKNFNPDQISLS